MKRTYTERKPIVRWIKSNLGVNINFIAKENNIEATKLYNFTKGRVRNPEIEKIFVALNVPQEIIDETFVS